MGESKFKLSKAEQDISTLKQSISQLEGQKLAFSGKVADELRAEKRKLQRESRVTLDKIEEVEITNSHLAKWLEKVKANRTTLLGQR